MSHRTCDVADCGKKHLARGYCSTHYNQILLGKDRRHPKVQIACAICGTRVTRSAGSEKRYVPTCSVECRTIVTFGQAHATADGYDWSSSAVTRARRAGVSVIVPFEREAVFERDAWTCQHCGVHCSAPDPYVKTSATVDHVVPHVRDGAHHIDNAQTLCLSCNSAKWAADVAGAATRAA